MRACVVGAGSAGIGGYYRPSPPEAVQRDCVHPGRRSESASVASIMVLA